MPGTELLVHLDIPVLLLDHSFVVRYANHKALELLNVELKVNEVTFDDIFETEIPLASRLKFLQAAQEPLKFNACSRHPNPLNLDIVLSAQRILGEPFYMLQCRLLKSAEDDFYRDILDHLPADVAVFDRNQNYLFVNRNAVKDDNVREWIVGKNDVDYARLRGLPEDLANNRQSRFSQVFSEETDYYSFEESIIRNGKKSTFLRIMKAVRDVKGKFRYAIGYGLNIDRIKEYESKIKNQEIAIEASPVGIAVLNELGEYTYLNDAHVKMYGFENASELLGKTWRIFYEEDEVQRIENEIFPLLIQNGRWTGETTGLMPPVGKKIHTDLSLSLLSDGGLVCICRDVTEKKESDLANQRMAVVASKTSNFVIICNANGEIEWVNDAFLMQSGYTIEEVLGKLPSDLLDGPETDQDVVQTLKDFTRMQIPFTGEKLSYMKDGSKVWQYLNVTPVFDDKGLLKNWVSVETNISLLKEAENRIREALEKEQQLGMMKSKFVSMASHEFRTPLAGIVTSVELVRLLLEKSGIVRDDRISFHLSKAMSEVERLTHLMDNVLLLGKIDSGKVILNIVEVPVNQFINEFISEFSLLWPGRNILLQHDTLDVFASFDTRIMRHILSNLVGNALKFSADDTDVSIRLYSESETFCIEIKDRGVGIPEEDQSQLFQHFFRASNTGQVEGSGMGLVIVKQFVELHNGRIRIQSSRNNGCIVTVCLPKSPVEL